MTDLMTNAKVHLWRPLLRALGVIPPPGAAAPLAAKASATAPTHVVSVNRAAGETYVEPPTPRPSKLAMFSVMDGWTTKFTIDGQVVGGPADLCNDARMRWHLDVIGGAQGKRALELGPLEGAHTKTMSEAGAREVTAIEGFRPAWLRCLITKEIFDLKNVHFLYGDFCEYVAAHDGPKYDYVLAAGVLYHQRNPARLIHDLARITDQVLVWTQIADDAFPTGGSPTEVSVGEKRYRGRVNDYQGGRNAFVNYCGGVHSTAVWLFADDMRRAFRDAGFTHMAEQPIAATPYGPCLLFVASKNADLKNVPLS